MPWPSPSWSRWHSIHPFFLTTAKCFLRNPSAALFIPAVSGVVRALFFHRMFWVQFVPMCLVRVLVLPGFLMP